MTTGHEDSGEQSPYWASDLALSWMAELERLSADIDVI